MMQIHLSGRLVRDPAQKTSSNGKPYVQALATASSGDTESLVTLMVFDTDLANLLASLRKGDSVSAIGSGSVRGYLDKEGKPAAGISVMVNRLMAMAEGKAAPRPKGNGQGRRPATAAAQKRFPDRPPLEVYDDPIPF
ncbi:MAG TPA: single-stranded DNA-binding protein [Armatimonadota bacterium]|nr:single-stranded DNA-binding protein [Armatimonadota bacterium]